WLGARPQIVSLSPYALADVFADMTRVAMALGARERGEQTVAVLRARMTAVAERARIAKTRPSFACIEWIEPLMSAGNWMPELVGMAGGTNLFGRAGEHSRWMKIEELAARDPDVIMVSPCGFPMERSRRELPTLTGSPHWNALRAVREHKVF